MERLIDANALLAFEKMDAELCASCGEEHTANDIIMMIKTAPTVAAVEVVRCKDCKHWNEGIGWCDQHSHYEEDEWNMFSADDFCSYGEKEADG